MELTLVIPDLHFPFECRKYTHAVLKAVKLLRPKRVVQLGDFMDCPQLSTYDKNPSRMSRFYLDLSYYNEFLDKLIDVMPRGSEFHQLCGNHERRLSRYVWRTAPDIVEIMPAWSKLLNFDERSAKKKVKLFWHDYEKWDSCKLPGNVVVHHGFYYDKHTAVNNLTRYPNVNFIQGHTHRVQYATNGRTWSATLGHGADTQAVAHEPTPSVSQHAFGIIYHSVNSAHLEIVQLENGKGIMQSKVLDYSK